MKVLTVTNMWPMQNSPYYGIFVKEQVEALKKYYPEVNNDVQFINGKKSKLNYIWSVFKINWLLTFNKYDVIHIHYALSGLFLLFNPFIKHNKVIITLHGSDFNSSKFLRKIVNAILKKSTTIICLNDTMLNNLEVFQKEMYLIPCGVDTDLFNDKEEKNQNNTINIVFPSSKSRQVKNYLLFEKIINNIESKYQIKINVVTLDRMTRVKINTVLNEADLLCMTSFTEGSPQVIKEALCCNTPIISSNVGDVKQLLKDVENCYVINSYLVDDFSDAIMKILNLPKENRKSNGRGKIFKLGLDEKSTSAKIIEAYFK